MDEDLKPQLITATVADYPIVQNLARFYVYDRSGYMGWGCEDNGMFECIDFKHYFENPNEKAFIVKVNDELAGFALLDKNTLIEPVDWNMGEFFIIAKFQGKGVASYVAKEIFKEHLGKWSISIMPENIKAVRFWRKIVNEITGGNYTELFKTASELRNIDNPDPCDMNILSFKL